MCARIGDLKDDDVEMRCTIDRVRTATQAWLESSSAWFAGDAAFIRAKRMALLYRGRRALLRSTLAAGCLYLPASLAADGTEADPVFSVSGFGTVGAIYHNAPGVRYRRDVAQGSGVGEQQLSFKPDSMLGVQFDTRPGQRLDATVQVVSRLTAEDNYQPELTMAYLKFRPQADTSVRLGRMMLETYLQGDAAEIGYANLLIRQPIIYYPRNFDGIDAETAYPLGAGVLRLKGAAGWTHGKLFSGGELYDTAGSGTLGGSVEYAWRGWTGRFHANRVTLDDELTALRPGAPLPELLASAPNGARILDRLSMQDRALTLRSLALAYDSGPLQGLASYSTISSADWPTRHILYANMGYRFGRVTPYAAYASQRSARDLIATGLPVGASFDMLNQASAAAQGAILLNQRNLALGARYDVAHNMALKLQLEHIRYRDPESILDAALLASPVAGRGTHSLNLLSVALDFVF